MGWKIRGGQEEEEGDFLLFFSGSQCVPIKIPKFSSCSQGVPNGTSILSHMVCPKFNSHGYKLKRWAIGQHICFYFCDLGSKEVHLLGGAQCSKKLVMGQLVYGPFPKKKKKKFECTHELINMNHTLGFFVKV
jgi:hypothetical protein